MYYPRMNEPAIITSNYYTHTTDLCSYLHTEHMPMYIYYIANVQLSTKLYIYIIVYVQRGYTFTDIYIELCQ